MKKIAFALVFVLVLSVLVAPGKAGAAQVYRVKSGDTLWKISNKLGVPVEIILNKNNINNPGNLYVGQKLVITISWEEDTDNDTQRYIVKSGDNLWKIAQKYGTTVEELISANNLEYPYYVYVGQTLRIPGRDNTDNNNDNQNEQNYIYYTVKPGDILWNIAQKYNTTVKKLVELNNIKNAYDLYAGRRLLVPTTTEPADEEDNDSGYHEENHRYVPYYFYRIQENDRIWTIADKFGVRVSTLINYNNIEDVNSIQVDDVLIIPLNYSSKMNYLKRVSSKLNNYYRVRGNETLAEISEYFGIPIEGLRAINQMTENEEVYTGQRLLMPVSPALFKKHEVYRVKSGGEYIYDIAFNKGIAIRPLLKANYLRNPNLKLKTGTVIVIPLDKDSQTLWIEYDENGEPLNSRFF